MAEAKADKVEAAIETASTDEKQNKHWLFKPGQSGNPKGRKRSSRNKLRDDFIDALQEDFEDHGKLAIATVRTERPHEYLKVVASILPKELNVRTDALNEMSDDELATMLGAIQSAVLAGAFATAGSGSEETARH